MKAREVLLVITLTVAVLAGVAAVGVLVLLAVLRFLAVHL